MKTITILLILILFIAVISCDSTNINDYNNLEITEFYENELPYEIIDILMEKIDKNERYFMYVNDVSPSKKLLEYINNKHAIDVMPRGKRGEFSVEDYNRHKKLNTKTPYFEQDSDNCRLLIVISYKKISNKLFNVKFAISKGPLSAKATFFNFFKLENEWQKRIIGGWAS